MKINIPENARVYLTDDEIKFLKLLELHETFYSELEALREEMGLKFGSDKEYPSYIGYEPQIARLLEKLNIPISLFYAIKSILYTGTLSDLEPPITIYQENNPLKVMTRRQRIVNELGFPYYGVPYPTIRIKKKLTKAELFECINEQWFMLEKLMGILENSAKFPIVVSHISMKDIDDSIKIYKYKKSGLKYKDIQKELEKDNNFLDEPSIRKKISNMNKLLIELKFVTK